MISRAAAAASVGRIIDLSCSAFPDSPNAFNTVKLTFDTNWEVTRSLCASVSESVLTSRNICSVENSNAKINEQSEVLTESAQRPQGNKRKTEKRSEKKNQLKTRIKRRNFWFRCVLRSMMDFGQSVILLSARRHFSGEFVRAMFMEINMLSFVLIFFRVLTFCFSFTFLALFEKWTAANRWRRIASALMNSLFFFFFLNKITICKSFNFNSIDSRACEHRQNCKLNKISIKTRFCDTINGLTFDCRWLTSRQLLAQLLFIFLWRRGMRHETRMFAHKSCTHSRVR